MDKTNENITPGKNSDDTGALERLIENLETEVSSIETQEIIRGLTSEELEEKGLTGEKKISISRSVFSDTRNKAGFDFIEGVEYFIATGRKDVSEIDFEELFKLKNVEPGQIVASKKLPETTRDADFKNILSFYNEQYLKNANIELKRDENFMRFVAKIKGKAVLIDSFLFIVSCDKDGKFDILIAPDKMLVIAGFYPHYCNGKPLQKDEIMSCLKDKGVTAGIKEPVIEENIALCNKDKKSYTGVVIAEGKAPVDGTPIEPVFFFSTDPTVDDFKILPDGRVDYRKNANIQIVKKGSVLAKNGLSRKGTDGFDVLGNILKATDGEPKQLINGENVLMANNGTEFIAESDGQVSLHGNVINVFQHYFVNGDVDFGVGNIDFNGNVTIKGMILSGFEVKASGDILVIKGIESAGVSAGRDLKVNGGIIGDGKHLVKCGRNLFANHLQNAYIEAQGDVSIGNSCVQSLVLCNGKVVLSNQKGAIVGGAVNALGGVEARIIGTEFGTKTEITVGKDYLVQKTLNELLKAIDFHNANLQKIDKVLTPLLELVKKGMSLGGEKKGKLSLIIDKRKQIKKSITIMKSKFAEIEKLSSNGSLPFVKISGTVFPDVTVRIMDCIKQINDAQDHLMLFYNKKSDEIETGPL
jgi:uncharacterized protein (DUF342 family)